MKSAASFLAVGLLSAVCLAQTASDNEEFEYNLRLVESTKSFTPKDGFVPNKEAAVTIAYAVALPVFGKSLLDSELPLRAELKNSVWTVLGTLHCQSCDGGTLVVQIDKASGKILFLIHTK